MCAVYCAVECEFGAVEGKIYVMEGEYASQEMNMRVCTVKGEYVL